MEPLIISRAGLAGNYVEQASQSPVACCSSSRSYARRASSIGVVGEPGSSG